jgi:hypothetical protein
MTVSITIRDVPVEVRDELAARAAMTGRSLQEYLRTTLLAIRPGIKVPLTRLRSHKAAAGASLPAEAILALKDEDRR